MNEAPDDRFVVSGRVWGARTDIIFEDNKFPMGINSGTQGSRTSLNYVSHLGYVRLYQILNIN